jgi:predicted metalloprotease with PDZ domain
VYEGQTQYWGEVLAARAGLMTHQEVLDLIALAAATYDHRVGREWRALEDTTNDPIIAQRRSQPWPSWGRREDYYYEGMFVWLDADTLIREKSNGKRSLDDVAKAFFGIDNGSYVTATYEFDDVVKALNAVQPYDWAGFLRTRLDGHGPGAPLDGLARGGYRLVYNETPSAYLRTIESTRNSTDLSYSIGTAVASDGRITSVLWDSPAFKAGITPGQQITAVNGTAFRGERLKDAVTQAKTTGRIELLVKNGDRYQTVAIEYHDGLRYPHLERTTTPARLDDILSPRN